MSERYIAEINLMKTQINNMNESLRVLELRLEESHKAIEILSGDMDIWYEVQREKMKGVKKNGLRKM